MATARACGVPLVSQNRAIGCDLRSGAIGNCAIGWTAIGNRRVFGLFEVSKSGFGKKNQSLALPALWLLGAPARWVAIGLRSVAILST